jgi:ergot alkaloid biosynthesis protein
MSMALPRILVTGASGNTGAQIAKRLIELGYAPRLASRSGKVTNDAETVRLDWTDEDTFATAVAAIDRVYLVSGMMADPYLAMKTLIDRAMHQGARRFVLLSSSMLPEGGPAMGMVHRYLHEHAPEWAVLQPSWFMQNFTGQHAASIREEGIIYSATGGGCVPFVDTQDIAEVGVHALIDEQPHNRAYVLTGPRVLSYEEVAEIIGKVRGRPVRHRGLTGEELAQRWRGFGMPREYAEMLAAMDVAIAAGAENRITDAVYSVTGRRARNFESFAEANAHVWR